MQQGKEGCPAERTVGVQVGVVCRPACHDLLVVHQSLAGVALGAAGHQHLMAGTFSRYSRQRSVLKATVPFCGPDLQSAVLVDAGGGGVVGGALLRVGAPARAPWSCICSHKHTASIKAFQMNERVCIFLSFLRSRAHASAASLGPYRCCRCCCPSWCCSG